MKPDLKKHLVDGGSVGLQLCSYLREVDGFSSEKLEGRWGMRCLRLGLILGAVIICIAASGFIPVDPQLGAEERSLPIGHGYFIQNVGQFGGGDFLLRTDLADFWISAGDLRISQVHKTVREDGEPRFIQDNFLLEFIGTSEEAVIEP